VTWPLGCGSPVIGLPGRLCCMTSCCQDQTLAYPSSCSEMVLLHCVQSPDVHRLVVAGRCCCLQMAPGCAARRGVEPITSRAAARMQPPLHPICCSNTSAIALAHPRALRIRLYRSLPANRGREEVMALGHPAPQSRNEGGPAEACTCKSMGGPEAGPGRCTIRAALTADVRTCQPYRPSPAKPGLPSPARRCIL
jgi:hypothetical protein